MGKASSPFYFQSPPPYGHLIPLKWKCPILIFQIQRPHVRPVPRAVKLLIRPPTTHHCKRSLYWRKRYINYVYIILQPPLLYLS